MAFRALSNGLSAKKTTSNLEFSGGRPANAWLYGLYDSFVSCESRVDLSSIRSLRCWSMAALLLDPKVGNLPACTSRASWDNSWARVAVCLLFARRERLGTNSGRLMTCGHPGRCLGSFVLLFGRIKSCGHPGQRFVFCAS